MNRCTRLPWLGMTVLVMLTAATQAQIVTTSFQTTIDESYVVLGAVQGTGSTASGSASFILTEDLANPLNNTLAYSIQLQNVDLDGAQTASVLDNIAALHLHDTTRCSPIVPQCIAGTDTAGTVHILNIYGAPRNDDADVVVDPVAGTITGLWDVSDTSTAGVTAPTLDISSSAVIDILTGGDAAIFVHTNEFPSAAAGGALVVPEPSSSVIVLLLGWCAMGWIRRR